jgi:hypothetical protein
MRELPPPLSWAVSLWQDRWAGGPWSGLLVVGRQRTGRGWVSQWLIGWCWLVRRSTRPGRPWLTAPMGHLLGYAPVSTTDQHPHLQVDALERAGCYRVFTETASGARTDRPALEELLDQLRPGDTLIVWKLDRLGRSLRHLVDTVTGLAERGVGFRSLQGGDRHHHPGRQARLPRVRGPGGVRTRPDPRTHRRRPGRGPGPWPPRRPALGAERPQAPGGPGDASGQYTMAVIATTLGVSRASIYRYVTGDAS